MVMKYAVIHRQRSWCILIQTAISFSFGDVLLRVDDRLSPRSSCRGVVTSRCQRREWSLSDTVIRCRDKPFPAKGATAYGHCVQWHMYFCRRVSDGQVFFTRKILVRCLISVGQRLASMRKVRFSFGENYRQCLPWCGRFLTQNIVLRCRDPSGYVVDTKSSRATPKSVRKGGLHIIVKFSATSWKVRLVGRPQTDMDSSLKLNFFCPSNSMKYFHFLIANITQSLDVLYILDFPLQNMNFICASFCSFIFLIIEHRIIICTCFQNLYSLYSFYDLDSLERIWNFNVYFSLYSQNC